MSKLREFLDIAGYCKPKPGLATDAALLGGVQLPDDEAHDDIKGADDVLVEFVCQIFIINKTDVALQLKREKLERGRYGKQPEATVPSRQSRQFTVIETRRAIGSVIFDLEQKRGRWEILYDFVPPYLPGGPTMNSNYDGDPRYTPEEAKDNKLELHYVLKMEDSPPPAPESFLSRVYLTNSTDVELRKRDHRRLAGVYETEPPRTIPPGSTIDFEVRSEGALTDQQLQLAAGALTWTPVGAVGSELWSVEFSAGIQSTAKSDIPANEHHVADPPIIQGKDFRFNLRNQGSPPPPRPESFVSIVRVINKTQVALFKGDDKLTSGTYEKSPANTIPAAPQGGSSTIEFAVRSQNKEDGGQLTELVSGAVNWEPDGPVVGEEWETKFAVSSTTKPGAEFKLSHIDSDYYIAEAGYPRGAFEFFLKPNRNAPPEPEFDPPSARSRQPTLRFGDVSKDGWVEYLQQLLNFHANNNKLKIDGDFREKTYKAVCDFQKKCKKEHKDLVMDDGIVGHQTWALLREGAFEKPGTDGRKPHTYEEKGAQARWQREKEKCIFLTNLNEAWLFVNSVGEQPIDDFNAMVLVTTLAGKKKKRVIKIGPPNQRMPNDQGNVHIVKLKHFRETFMDKQDLGRDDLVSAYVIDAYFERYDILGTDRLDQARFAVG